MYSTFTTGTSGRTLVNELSSPHPAPTLRSILGHPSRVALLAGITSIMLFGAGCDDDDGGGAAADGSVSADQGVSPDQGLPSDDGVAADEGVAADDGVPDVGPPTRTLAHPKRPRSSCSWRRSAGPTR